MGDGIEWPWTAEPEDGEYSWTPAAAEQLPRAADVAALLESEEHDGGDATVVLAASTYRASRALLLALAAAAAPPGSPEAHAWGDGAPVAAEADQTARRLVGEALRRQLGAASDALEASFEAEGAGLVMRLRRRQRAEEDLGFAPQGSAGSAAAVPAAVLGRRCPEVEKATPKSAAASDESEAAAAMEQLTRELGALAAAAGSATLPLRPPPATARRAGAAARVRPHRGSLAIPGSWGGGGADRGRSWRPSASCCDRRSAARETPPDVHSAQGARSSAAPGADPQERAVAKLLQDHATRVKLLDGLGDAERAEGARELAEGLRRTQRVQLADIASPNSVALEVPVGDFFPEPPNPVVAAWALAALALVVDAAMGGRGIAGRSLQAVELRGRGGCAVSLARGSQCYIA